MQQRSDDRLVAYLDGELEVAQRREVEAWLEADPAAPVIPGLHRGGASIAEVAGGGDAARAEWGRGGVDAFYDWHLNGNRSPGDTMAVTDSRVTIHMAASLDGFIARKDGSVDWL